MLPIIPESALEDRPGRLNKKSTLAEASVLFVVFMIYFKPTIPL